MTNHVVTLKTYTLVFAGLACLTVATVLIAEVDLGPLNVIAALTIATAKALLVALFFMDLIHTRGRTLLTILAGLLWLLLLITFTLGDEFSRGWLPIPRGW
jgi:cytochrome c oxidase subunit 4